MVTSKTKVAVEAVASASALVADTTVGTRGLFPVFVGNRWGRFLSGDGARDVSFRFVGLNNLEFRLTTMVTLGSCEELQQLLPSGVVTISEKDRNFWVCLVGLININLNLGNCEVGECLQSILNRIGILIRAHSGCVNLDGTSVVLTTELVNKTELEESFLHSCTFKVASQLLVIVATIRLTVGLGVVAFGTPAE